MMLLLALTGSIAMGKSHAARIFRAFGIPVFDADATVHSLMAKGGPAVPPVLEAFPEAAGPDGTIDRPTLGRLVFADPAARHRLEAIVHPLVRIAEKTFLERACRAGTPLVLLDIPLLYETGGERRVDRVAVVSASQPLQTARALARPGMTAARLDGIRLSQLDDPTKRRRADFVIHAGYDRGATVRQIEAILRLLQGEQGTAWPRRWQQSAKRPEFHPGPAGATRPRAPDPRQPLP
jgi:dephospho-CoA kinase